MRVGVRIMVGLMVWGWRGGGEGMRMGLGGKVGGRWGR